MTLTEKEIYETAGKLVRSARRRAPSFVFLNIVFNQELEQVDATEEEKKQIRDVARSYIARHPA